MSIPFYIYFYTGEIWFHNEHYPMKYGTII